MPRKSKRPNTTQNTLPGGIRRIALREASEVTGLSVSTIRRACLSGDLRFMRPSGSCNAPIHVAERDLLDWLDRCEQHKQVLSPAETRAMRGRICEDD